MGDLNNAAIQHLHKTPQKKKRWLGKTMTLQRHKESLMPREKQEQGE